MKRFKRIAALAMVGFLTFAPPGTMIFGVTFVLGLGGYLFNRSQSAEPQRQQSTQQSTARKPETFSELPAYLESFLPPHARGAVRVTGNTVSATFTSANEISPREKAHQNARDFIFAVYGTGLPVESAHISIAQSDGNTGLTITLGANVAASKGETFWSDPMITPTLFINWMEERHRTQGNAEGANAARIGGIWAEE